MICAHLTIGGPGAYVPPNVRAEAASVAGFAEMGWSVTDYERARREGWTPASLRDCFDAHGVRVAELEFLHGWARAETDDSSWQRAEALLFEMAAAFDARHLNCGDIGRGAAPLPADQVVERFRGICARAEEHGVSVALEFMPFGCIPDLAAAWALCQSAGHSNGGILVDAWHLFRSGATAEAIREVPPDRIVAVQLSDAAMTADGDLFADTLQRRRFPGDGELDLLGLLRVLDQHGVVAPVSVEVISSAVRAMSPHAAAKRAAESTNRLLEEARGRTLQ